MLHNVPWFELVGRATETGSLRRSGSGDMEEKHCAASKTHLPSRPWSPRERGGRMKEVDYLSMQLSRACVFHEISLIKNTPYIFWPYMVRVRRCLIRS